MATSEYYAFTFLLSLALKGFGFASGFARLVRESVFFEGQHANQVARNRMQELVKSGWVAFKSSDGSERVYHATQAGIDHLRMIVADPDGYYAPKTVGAKPSRMPAFVKFTGVRCEHLPANAVNPRNRKFGLHEAMCDRVAMDWLSVVLHPIRLESPEGTVLRGRLDMVWPLIEPVLQADAVAVGQSAVSPDAVLVADGSLSHPNGEPVRFTRVAFIECEHTSRNAEAKLLTYARWIDSGGYATWYEGVKSRYRLADAIPAPVVGFVFADASAEGSSVTRVRERLLGSGTAFVGANVRTAHMPDDFTQSVWRPLCSERDERTALFR